MEIVPGEIIAILQVRELLKLEFQMGLKTFWKYQNHSFRNMWTDKIT